MQWVLGVLPQGIKQPGLEVEHSLPPSAKLKKEWRCTSIAPTVLSWYGQGQLYFFFYLSHKLLLHNVQDEICDLKTRLR